MTTEEQNYIEKEFRYSWNAKYHKYINEWLSRITPLQKSFIKSWSRGFMSPATDPDGDKIEIETK